MNTTGLCFKKLNAKLLYLKKKVGKVSEASAIKFSLAKIPFIFAYSIARPPV